MPAATLKELRTWIGDSIARARRLGAFGPLVRLRVADDIAAEAQDQTAQVARHAYSAEQSDIEAGRIMEQVLADGHVDRAEMPMLRRALRLVRRSADADREVSNLTTL